MSHFSEHKRMKPVLDLARKLDIASNPHPQAIFEAGSGGFQIWCTLHDHPKGWNGITMQVGSFSKPCEYVGSAVWKWEEDEIMAIQIETTAYALMEQKPQEYRSQLEANPGDTRPSAYNREEDLAWLKEKIAWLFEQAEVDLPPCVHDPLPDCEPARFLLAQYVSQDDEYIVIVSPGSDPQDFCLPGCQLLQTLEIWNAGDFPLDMPLRADHPNIEPEAEPDEGPLVEQYENASRLHDDDWLEAAWEDRISGWEE
jgi:hypothetical protein